MTRFQTWYSAQPRAFRALLTINVVVYIFWVLIFANIPFTKALFENHLALNTGLPRPLFEPWQFITYNFLHLGPLGLDSLLHIGFNMLWLYWIGRDHEDLHGPYQITSLYFITGLGGGLLSVVVYAAFPSLVGPEGIFIHGASASVIGISMAVAVMYPRKKIALLLIGPVRLLYLMLAFLAFDVLFRFGGKVAVMAHLGGALFGFLFVKIEENGMDLSSWTRIFFQGRRARNITPIARGGTMMQRLEARMASRRSEEPSQSKSKKRGTSPMAKIRTLHPAEKKEERPLIDEVDRILEKISEEGMDSLTEEERRVLYEASRR